MQFTPPTYSLGFFVALVVGIVALVTGFMGMLPKEAVMLIVAVCAVRL